MPKYRVTAPDGRTYEVTAPEGATPEQVRARVEQMARTSARARGLEPVNADPTADMSFGQQVAADAGGRLAQFGLGIRQRLGLADADDAREQERLQAPLRDSPGGGVGSLATDLALVPLTGGIPGAARVGGAALIGAGYGAAQPTESAAETATNVGLGLGLGGLGQYGGNKISNALGGLLSRRAESAAARASANQPLTDALRNADELGLAVAPAATNPTLTNRALNGLVGKDMLARGARVQNQERVNQAAREALGVSESTPLSRQTLEGIRQQEAQVYAQIARNQQRIVPDDQYLDDLSAIEGRLANIGDDFPDFDVQARDEVRGLVDSVLVDDFSTTSALAVVRRLRQKANSLFRSAQSGAGNADADALAHATRDAADAVEEQMLRHLQANGDEAAAEAFDAARRRIAISHTVENALNDAGQIDPQFLARQWRADKPLSGRLEQVARAADSFRDTVRKPSGADAALATLFTGGLGGVAGYGVTGDMQGAALGAAGLNLARPAVRNALLSRLGQRLTATPSYAPNRLGTLMLKAPRYAASRGGALAAVAAMNNQ